MLDKEELNELYQSLVLDHSKKPRNWGTIENSYHTKGKNPSCGDEIELYMLINESSIIEDIKFKGVGCALCISSTSLLTQLLKNKDIGYAQEILKSFVNFILYEEKFPEIYEPLHIFQGVHNFPLRVKCVLLGWRALEKNIQNYLKEKDEYNH